MSAFTSSTFTTSPRFFKSSPVVRVSPKMISYQNKKHRIHTSGDGSEYFNCKIPFRTGMMTMSALDTKEHETHWILADLCIYTRWGKEKYFDVKKRQRRQDNAMRKQKEYYAITNAFTRVCDMDGYHFEIRKPLKSAPIDIPAPTPAPTTLHMIEQLFTDDEPMEIPTSHLPPSPITLAMIDEEYAIRFSSSDDDEPPRKRMKEPHTHTHRETQATPDISTIVICPYVPPLRKRMKEPHTQTHRETQATPDIHHPIYPRPTHYSIRCVEQARTHTLNPTPPLSDRLYKKGYMPELLVACASRRVFPFYQHIQISHRDWLGVKRRVLPPNWFNENKCLWNCPHERIHAHIQKAIARECD